MEAGYLGESISLGRREAAELGWRRRGFLGAEDRERKGRMDARHCRRLQGQQRAALSGRDTGKVGQHGGRGPGWGPQLEWEGECLGFL